MVFNLQECCAASVCSQLPTLYDSVSVPPSRVKMPKKQIAKTADLNYTAATAKNLAQIGYVYVRVRLRVNTPQQLAYASNR
jgi:hypothetical protein